MVDADLLMLDDIDFLTGSYNRDFTPELLYVLDQREHSKKNLPTIITSQYSCAELAVNKRDHAVRISSRISRTTTESTRCER
jgi:chromosomal replication initiation ATPase DnaA